MSSIKALQNRIDRLLAVIDQVKNAIFHLPVRFIKIDDTGNERIIYETPYNPHFKGMNYKEYINIEEWEEGSEP